MPGSRRRGGDASEIPGPRGNPEVASVADRIVPADDLASRVEPFARGSSVLAERPAPRVGADAATEERLIGVQLLRQELPDVLILEPLDAAEDWQVEDGLA